MQGAEERRLNRMGQYAARRGAVKGNAADDALMVDQGQKKVAFHRVLEYKVSPD
jgi:homogentisate 1,2-dioxygenase